MFSEHDTQGYDNPFPGIRIKTLCYGERTLMTEFKLEGGANLSMHAHPYEQTGYLVSGRIRLTAGEAVHDVAPGDSWCIPMNVNHGAQIIEDSVAIEVFSPVRQDYLPKNSS
jgi:quercetin dioxygenase-like cupin family protein